MHEGLLFMHHFFNVQIIFMRERSSLVNVHSLAVKNSRVPGIHYVFDEVGCTVHLGVVAKAMRVINSTRILVLGVSLLVLFYFFHGPQLEKLATMTNQFEPRIHFLSLGFTISLEALQLNEFDRIHGTFWRP